MDAYLTAFEKAYNLNQVDPEEKLRYLASLLCPQAIEAISQMVGGRQASTPSPSTYVWLFSPGLRPLCFPVGAEGGGQWGDLGQRELWSDPGWCSLTRC